MIRKPSSSFLHPYLSFSSSLLLFLLLITSYHLQEVCGLARNDFPTNITLRAAVLTHAEPFAMKDESTGEFYGLQLDLLERLKQFALEDGVTLNIELEEAPMYAYVLMFDRLSDNCNTTDNPQPLEECTRYDLLIGDYYTNADRSLRVDFTPPFLRTAVSALQYVFADTTQWRGDVTTMLEAQQSNATICVVDGSYMDAVAMERYPNAQYYKCSDPEDCIAQLKSSRCPLFVDDELQLRYRTVNDPTLQVTQEDFNSQFIVWPMRTSLEYAVRKLMKRWMYAAKSNATLDGLYNDYFSVNLCPLGYSGMDCNDPCHPSHGRSDRTGTCVCESTKWTGDSCSIEVLQDTNGIPSALRLIGYIMVGINFTATLLCFTWLFLYRNSPQVQVAQPSFLCLVLIGCLISTFTIVPLAQENLTLTTEDDTINDIWCMSIPWTYSVGFSITFGTLFAKIRRVYVLFKSAVSTRRISISWKETLSIIGVVLLLDVCILTAWTVVDPLHWERTILLTDKYGDPLSSEGYCTGQQWQIFAGMIALLHFGLLGFACYLCYVARDIPTKFSEGRYLAIAMVSNMQIFVVGVPILIILGNDPQSSFFVRSVIIWMNDLVVISLIFGNLMYSLWLDQQSGVDSKVAIRSAFQQYSTRYHARSSVVQSTASVHFADPAISTHNHATADTGPGLSHISESNNGEAATEQDDPSSEMRRSSGRGGKTQRIDNSNNVRGSTNSTKSRNKHGTETTTNNNDDNTFNKSASTRERPPDSWAVVDEDEDLEVARGSRASRSKSLLVPGTSTTTKKPKRRSLLSFSGQHKNKTKTKKNEPRRSKTGGRERPPDSWAGISPVSGNFDDYDDYDDDGDDHMMPTYSDESGSSTADPSSLGIVSSDLMAMEQIPEEDGNGNGGDRQRGGAKTTTAATSADETSRSTSRKSLLQPSNLPRNSSSRFDYASSRIHRIRESVTSEMESSSQTGHTPLPR